MTWNPRKAMSYTSLRKQPYNLLLKIYAEKHLQFCFCKVRSSVNISSLESHYIYHLLKARKMEHMKNESKPQATYLPKNESGTSYPPDRTVLLVIDPVNDFLSEGGAAWELTKNTVKMNNVIENLQRVIAGARAAGIPVLFGPMAYTEEDYADEQLQKRSGINRMMFEMKMFQADSWGADFHPDLTPLAGDIILQPIKAAMYYKPIWPMN